QGTRLDLESRDKWNDEYPMVRIRDLRNDPVNFELQAEELKKSSTLPSGGLLIREDSLLISRKFDNLRPTLLIIKDQPVWISSDIIAVKVNPEKIFLPYLIIELHSEQVKAQVKAFSSG